jgi:hypothetical protein
MIVSGVCQSTKPKVTGSNPVGRTFRSPSTREVAPSVLTDLGKRDEFTAFLKKSKIGSGQFRPFARL